MNEQPLRIGYIGAGMLAQRVHLPTFASLPGCRLLALAEVRRDLGQRVAARFGIPRCYADHQAMLADADIEAVALSAGFALQGELARDCLAAGKHVFMEKPMAVSTAQGDRILAAAREGNARLMVAYMKRYDPGNVLARATVAGWRESGELGNVLYARSHGFCGNWLAGLDESRMLTTDEPVPPAPLEPYLPAWLPPDRAGAYVGYLQQYTHNVNLLRYLLDSGDDARVRMVDLAADGMTGLAVLDLAGVRATVESGSMAHHAWDEHTQVYFERGWVHVWSPPLMAGAAQARVEVYVGGDRPEYSYPVPQPADAWAYREEAAHFIRALRTGEPFRSCGEDTLTDVRLFEDIYRQHLRIPSAAA